VTAVPVKGFARSGKVDFSIDAILAPDGRQIPLRYTLNRNAGESRARIGALVYAIGGIAALAVLEGHEATLYEGVQYDVYTDAAFTIETPIPSAPHGVSKPATVPDDSTPPGAPSIAVVYFLDQARHTVAAPGGALERSGPRGLRNHRSVR
jgi:hypothetical protein